MKADNLQVGIVPRDLHQSIEFYRDVIGLEVGDTIDLGEGRVLHTFNVGAGVLKLWESPDTPGHSPIESWELLTGLRWVSMNVDELDAAVERCLAAGAPVPLPATEIRPGLRVANIIDPDGNRVELIELS